MDRFVGAGGFACPGGCAPLRIARLVSSLRIELTTIFAASL